MGKDFMWLARRLRAMSVPEVLWRFEQKLLCKREERSYSAAKVAVTSHVFDPALSNLAMHPERMHINAGNQNFQCSSCIKLLGGFEYDDFRRDWHASFGSGGHWPMEFSYRMDYKQREDIGDVRLNWELNRHFQFAVLAKNYAATGRHEFLSELEDLFSDWNQKNPFLWGISWTSAMEIAIRVSNWCYTYAFLSSAKDVPPGLMNQLRNGIINMTDYIAQHYSRFSSANNHLIVEAYAIGQSGILLNHQPWTQLAVKILTRELPLQNYPDGVNKELSLHYQAFYMEAMGLMLRLLKKNGMDVPPSWEKMLVAMCRYLVACMGKFGEVIEFGDSDEGKLLSLSPNEAYYTRLLELYSFLLPERYIGTETVTETGSWLFADAERADMLVKPLYAETNSRCFRTGGNSFLRSKDGRVFVGIDHAALGFGSLAAHGHADALSIQLFVDGVPVLTDPGTYSYHSSKDSRDAYRSTGNHNTVCLDGGDQSEMLGAFLWGRKANCSLLTADLGADQDIIVAEHDGYAPVKVKRGICFDRNRTLKIEDHVEGEGRAEITFVLGTQVSVETCTLTEAVLDAAGVKVSLTLHGGDARVSWSLRKLNISERYGIEKQTIVLMADCEIHGHVNIETRIHIIE